MKQKKKTLLWRIKHVDQAGFSYVFGTMHVKNSAFFSNLDQVYESIQQVEFYAAEYDFNESNIGLDPMLFQLPDSSILSDWISEKKYNKLRNIILKAFGVDLDQMQTLLPMFTVNLITQQILSQNSTVSLDEHLWNYAQEQEKQCTGVERFQEQINVLQQIEVKEQVKMLLQIGQQVNKYKKGLLQTSEIYQSGDIQRLYQVTKKSSGKMRNLLLYRRNHLMAERIAELASSNTTFAAIGAAHLAGEKGVLTYLKQKGLSVKPISISPRK